MKTYEVLAGPNRFALGQLVSQKLNAGYELHGSPFVDEHGNFYQAAIK